MSALDLRERIETALRARNGGGPVRVEVREHDAAQWRASAYVGEPVGEDIHGRPRGGELDALAALALAVGLDADGTDPRAEVDHLDALLARQHAILTGVANALRGDPGPLASHSHHDLAERAAATVAEVETLRRTLALAQESLAAAVRDERVTVVDEVARLQRERDEARADAAALRAAAREYLDAQDLGDRALDSWLRADDTDRDADAAQAASRWRTTQARIVLRAAIDVATMRRDLPAEAVVSCPACGYGITADLDDGAYVTRRHSRREPARVGAGEIVWCDGGLVRP